MVPVAVPDLIDDELVGLQLVGHLASVPVPAAVVQSETELHPVFVGEAEEQFEQIHGRHVATLFEKILARVGEEFAVAAADEDHGVDAHRLHIPEIQIPLLGSPVLVRNVMRDLVQERPADRQCVPLWDDQCAVDALVNGESFLIIALICRAGCQRCCHCGRGGHPGALEERSSVCHTMCYLM